MLVIAFDPGGTTGYAHGIIKDGSMYVLTGQHKWRHKDLWDHLRETLPSIIVYETFDFRRKKQRDKVELFARELIGTIELYAETYEVKLYKQTPAQAKGYWSDLKLKADKVYKTSKPHANDAARHLLYWYEFGSGFQYNKNGFISEGMIK